MLLTNGKLPSLVLRAIPWATSQYVRFDILDNLIALNKAFRGVFGYNLTVNEGYRTYARQQDYYADPPSGVGTAARPGTSNHGWGLAIDFGNLGGKYGKPYLWMLANAPKFGFVNPLWARDGVGVEEPWHWESNKAKNVVPDQIKEFDMAISQADADLIVGTLLNYANPDSRESVYKLLIDAEANAFGNQTVRRGAENVAALQELADTKTIVMRLEAALAEQQALIAALSAAQGVDTEALSAAVVDGLVNGVVFNTSVQVTEKP